MIIHTTIEELPERVKGLDIPPETQILVFLEDKETGTEPIGVDEEIPENGKWSKVAKRFREEGFLAGKSEQVNELLKDFRESFKLK